MLRYLVFPFILIATVVAARADDSAGYYQGKLGAKQTINLRINAEGAGFAGQYRYAKFGSPIWLTKVKGIEADDITLEEIDPHAQDDPAGRFHGRVDDDNALVGNWTSADGKRVLPFKLQRTAELLQFSSSTPRYKVRCAAPRFESKSAFYTALNDKLARDAKESQTKSAAEFEKSTSDPDLQTASFPWERSNDIDILYADEKIVSLCYQVYEYSGGAHGNVAYDSAIYAWCDGQLVELHTKDLLQSNSRTALNSLIVQDLKRQKAPWANNARTDELKDLVINPTATGLVITIPPYEVGPWADGTFTVMLPYKSLTEVIRPEGPLGRFMDADKASASVSP